MNQKRAPSRSGNGAVRPGRVRVAIGTAAALAAALGWGGLLAACAGTAHGQTVPAAAQTAPDRPQGVAAGAEPAPAAASAAPATWWSTVAYGAQLDAGITGNVDRPADGLNFGRLFADKANTVLLNQIQLTATRPIDSAAAGYDLGFVLQAAYGSDARYTHYLGEFDVLTGDRNQFTVLQADLLLHAPWLVQGGIDLKLGQFVTPIGYEVTDPGKNPFYSHSYLFNFGPYQHTGLQAIVHVSPTLDLYGQVDTGESTTFGGGDNNAEPAGLFGVGLNNLAGGKLTLLALMHLGPEAATNALGAAANGDMRYEGDVVATYKAASRLTLAGEAQWQHDDSYGADSYGAAGYLSYALTPWLAVNVRGEVYRDNSGFFVLAYPGNLDAVRALDGLPNTSFDEGRQTYSEWTWGISYRPAIPHVALLAFRPEMRWDKSFSGGHPYNDGRQTGSFTLAADVILGF